jgi:hypothetical protein
VVKDLQEVFGGQRLSEISYLDLETYRNRRKATPTKAAKPRTDASVNRDMAILGHADLKMILRYAHLQEAVAVLNSLGTGHQTPKN